MLLVLKGASANVFIIESRKTIIMLRYHVTLFFQFVITTELEINNRKVLLETKNKLSKKILEQVKTSRFSVIALYISKFIATFTAIPKK